MSLLESSSQKPVLVDVVLQLIEAALDPVELPKAIEELTVEQDAAANKRQSLLSFDVACEQPALEEILARLGEQECDEIQQDLANKL